MVNKLTYKHPVSIRVVSSHKEVYFLSAKDCVYDNEIVYCVENGKYYEGFLPVGEDTKYYFKEFTPLRNKCCDLCGAIDTYDHRMVLYKVTVDKPSHLIDASAKAFIESYSHLKQPTIDKYICARCKEAIKYLC